MIFVFLLILIKSLVWAAVVPIFQTPDEQAHFTQLQWYAEAKSLKIGSKNLSLEVAAAEEILGTRRDESGNNKYTYHPEYKNSARIPDFPVSYRTIYVDQEAAGYPPLYYLLGLPFYSAVYDANLVDRVLASRLLSTVLSLLLALVTYKIGRLIWKDKVMSAVLTVIISFQPMVSFVSTGFHPDNLLNLLYSLGILLLLLVLKNGVKANYLLFLALVIFLGLETKILMVFFLPVAAAIVIYKLFSETKWGIILATLCLILPVIAFWRRFPLPYMPAVTSASPLARMDFGEYLQFRGPKTLFEMWPWFWGVFKWLGVTLPPLVMKIITRVAILAGIGLVVRLWRQRDFEFRALVLFSLSLISYFLYLIFWDWRLMQSIGYSQGLQGRYLFPNIIPAMFLLLVGLVAIHKKLAIPTALAMVVLNIIALHTVYVSY